MLSTIAVLAAKIPKTLFKTWSIKPRPAHTYSSLYIKTYLPRDYPYTVVLPLFSFHRRHDYFHAVAA